MPMKRSTDFQWNSLGDEEWSMEGAKRLVMDVVAAARRNHRLTSTVHDSFGDDAPRPFFFYRRFYHRQIRRRHHCCLKLPWLRLEAAAFDTTGQGRARGPSIGSDAELNERSELKTFIR